MEAELNSAGIPTAEAWRACGTDEAYRRLLCSIVRQHFIAYYVMNLLCDEDGSPRPPTE